MKTKQKAANPFPTLGGVFPFTVEAFFWEGE